MKMGNAKSLGVSNDGLSISIDIKFGTQGMMNGNDAGYLVKDNIEDIVTSILEEKQNEGVMIDNYGNEVGRWKVNII